LNILELQVLFFREGCKLYLSLSQLAMNIFQYLGRNWTHFEVSQEFLEIDCSIRILSAFHKLRQCIEIVTWVDTGRSKYVNQLAADDPQVSLFALRAGNHERVIKLQVILETRAQFQQIDVERALAASQRCFFCVRVNSDAMLLLRFGRS
jgi:hypothetical protein